MRSDYTYDAYGNQLTSKLSKDNKDGSPSILSKTEYTENGNHTASTTNARGKQAHQQVDETSGTLSWVKGPNEQQVNYTYDGSKRLSSVQTAADGKTYRNQYTYDKGRLKTVKHNTDGNAANDVTYTFEYDALGAQTQVKVGDKVLSTNVYDTDRSHKLLRSEFANGGTVHNSYDEFDRLT
ncbi:hypothetical protein LJC33_08140, partial [Eubacteriales bacterium OttesenSCG-928-N13]|nr:hypothetical protein [Eubacteriales bacterium OttesenSCG-928-N13]